MKKFLIVVGLLLLIGFIGSKLWPVKLVPSRGLDAVRMMSAQERAALFHEMILRGFTCDRVLGVRFFEEDSRTAAWIVNCADGGEYAVLVATDRAGTVSVADCREVEVAC